MIKKTRKESRFIGLLETAQYLGCGKQTLYKLVAAGQMPAFKTAGSRVWKFDRQDLETWIEKQKQQVPMVPMAPIPTASKSPSENVTEIPRQRHIEKVTLPLTTAQKDLLDALGKKLQRQRAWKDQDLNRNTIIRALIGILDEGFFDGVSVSSEVELENWVKNRLKK